MSAVIRLRRLCLVLACAVSLLPAGAAAQSPVVAAQSPEASPAASPTPAPLEPAGTWTVTAFDAWGEGLAEPRVAGELTIALQDGGRLEGQTGCGRYNGGYSIDGERIGLGIISKGFGECGRKRTEEAVAFSVALEAVSRWRLDTGAAGLELVDDTGAVRVAATRRPDAQPFGDWLVTGYTRANGASAQPPDGQPMRLSITADGGLSGNGGCRELEGEVRVEADRIVLGPIEALGPPCDGPVRRAERRLLTAYSEVVYFERDGEALTLLDAFDRPLVELVAPAPAATSSVDPVASPTASPLASLPPPSEDGG